MRVAERRDGERVVVPVDVGHERELLITEGELDLLLRQSLLHPHPEFGQIQVVAKAAPQRKQEVEMYKPADHNSVSPYLLVEDAAAALAFIKAVFGSDPAMTHKAADGSIVHAEVLIDDTVVMLGQMQGSSAPAHVHVYVRDVDASFEAASSAGGTVVQEVLEKGDGDRRGGIADPTGTIWWLATHQGSRDV